MTEDCLSTSQIRIDGGTQPREVIDQSYVDELSEAIASGTELPPVDVFNDGAAYWLGDGFHRFFAHQKLDRPIRCRIHVGLQREAVLFSVGANAGHGLRRTNADKRRAVTTVLTNELVCKNEAGKPWSDRAIARLCNVGHPLVSEIRSSVTGISSSEERAYTTKHGTVATMKTGNIGKQKPSAYIPKSDDVPSTRKPRQPLDASTEVDGIKDDGYLAAYLIRAEQAREFAFFRGPTVSRNMVDEARGAAAAWNRLADELEARL